MEIDRSYPGKQSLVVSALKGEGLADWFSFLIEENCRPDSLMEVDYERRFAPHICMSWTSAFPVLTDEMIDQFQVEATKEEQIELDQWFSIKKVINPQPAIRHVVSTSLFWKNPKQEDPELRAADLLNIVGSAEWSNFVD